MMVFRRHGVVVATMLAVLPAAADAQLLDRYFPANVPRTAFGALPTVQRPEDITVAARRRPELDYAGVRLGSFMLRPRGAESIGYDDNIFAQGNKKDAAALRSEGVIDLGSDWSRHAVYVTAGVDDYRLLGQPSDAPSQSRTNWNVAAGGALQIGRDVLSGGYSHLRLHQERTDVEGGLISSPLPFDIDDFRVAYRTDIGRFSFAPDVAFQTTRFSNDATFAGTIDPTTGAVLGSSLGSTGGLVGGLGGGGITSVPFQVGTDRNVIDGGLTTRYTLSPLRDLVLVTRGSSTNFLDEGTGSVSRDSTTFSGLLGFDDSSSGVFGYRVLAGVQVRDFKSRELNTRTRPIVEAAVTYSPTRLTTLTGLVSRRLEDAAAEASSGYTFTQARLTVDHEYLRDVILSAYGQFLEAKFIEGGNNQVFGAGGKATWLLNRNMRLALTYDFADRSANRGLDYSRNIALLRVEFGL